MAAKKTARRGASATQKRGSKKPVPGWLWLGSGVAIGILATLLVNLAPEAGVDARTVAGNSGAKGTGEIVSKKKDSPEKKPVFDFYTLLPESEVMVPGTTKREPVKPQKTENPAVVPSLVSHVPAVVVATPSRRYLLQAGSFRNPEDADRLRAQLILWGLDARVERVIVKGGDAWHRVQMGPFAEQAALKEARQTLVSHKVDSLMLQLK